MAGFCYVMKGEQSQENKSTMLDYSVSLLVQSNDLLWFTKKKKKKNRKNRKINALSILFNRG